MHARNPDTDPRLQLEPPGSRAYLWLFLLCVALPVALSGVALAFAGDDNPMQRILSDSMIATRWLGPLLVAAVTGAIWLVLDLAMRRHRLTLDENALTVRTSFYTNRLAISELRLDHARVLDLDEFPQRKPFIKTNGFALPGFRSGWFRSREFKKLFVATADGKRLLWLPTTRDHTLLLQPRSPQVLLDRLRQLHNHPTHL